MPTINQNNKKPQKVIVAMSGGVDSSVAAALLVREFEHVSGVMLKLWSDPSTENLCCGQDSISLAKQVASQINIPFYTIDAIGPFRERVVEHFLLSYKQGNTPNPCIICNRQVRWDLLLKHADEIGARFIATGHYARLARDESGYIQLLKGVDNQKDQSYVLHCLTQGALSRTLLPLGNYKKSEIRDIAKKLTLPVSERPDSQDLCFVGNQGYRDFLIRHAPEVVNPGPIKSTAGEVIGEHRGLAFYTIGQRKGINIPAASPYYVLDKDADQNTLIVGTKADLGKNQARVDRVNWISGKSTNTPFRATIKIRYKAKEVWGWVKTLKEDQVEIIFDHPIRDITPGQSAVFYHEEVCLGGGIIT